VDNTTPDYWYRQIHATSWVAYRGRQAIWETTTERELLRWLQAHGIEATRHQLHITNCR
jgi:hypothetical protein